jgi:hypothetical protein
MNKKIQTHETQIATSIVFSNGKPSFDGNAEKIYDLIENYLQFIAVDASGWEKLYRDPEDRRLWRLSYDESDSHGGGAPRLDVVDRSIAIDTFGPFD